MLVAGFTTGFLALVLFATLAEDVVKQETTRLDGAVFLWLQSFRSPWADRAALALSARGYQMVLVLLAALLVLFALKRQWRTAGCILAAVIILVGLARLFLGVHYFTDVVAGYLAGFLWTDSVIIASRLLEKHRQRRTPASRPAARSAEAPG